MANVRLSKRRNGGIHVIQGSSFMLLTRGEAVQLIRDIQRMLDDDSPNGAETMNHGKDH